MKQLRCPHCNQLLVEVSDEISGELKLFCRRCKSRIYYAFPLLVKQPA